MKKLKSNYLLVVPEQHMLITLSYEGIFARSFQILFLTAAIVICSALSKVNAQNLYMDNTDKSTHFENKNLNTVTTGFAKLFDFYAPESGTFPEEIINSGSFLYGTTSKLYKIKTDGTGFIDFALSDINEMGESITISDTLLFGIKYDLYGYGHIFSVNLNGTNYKDIYSFTDENLPRYNIRAKENAIYGVKYGKYDGKSYVFKLNPDGSDFEEYQSVGDFPYGKVLIEDNYMYGTTAGPIGSTDNLGTVYKIKTDGTDYKRLHRFNIPEEGESPLASLTSFGEVLYGSTKEGGVNDCGIIFRINKDGTNFKVLHHFALVEGYGIRANLIFSENSLFGASYQGGSSDHGTLFKINTDGSGFRKLHDFNGIDGYRPVNLVLSGDSIFGVTRKGGLNGKGTIFRYVIEKHKITPVEPPKIVTLSIRKPEEIILETQKDLIIDIGNYIDLDTTFFINGDISFSHTWNVKTGKDFQEINNNNVNINQDVTFYLFVTTDQGCTYIDSVSVLAKNITGIEEKVTNENQLTIYPNPNAGIFQIEIQGGNAKFEYNIFDNLGKKVSNGIIFCGANKCIQNIKLNNIEPGTYHLIMRRGDMFYGQKKLMVISK